MAASSNRAMALDGIRGIAAVAVLLFHCGLYMHALGFVGHGALAVDVFFCMSGFVVERAYGEHVRKGWSAMAFARVRLRRLYPLYAVGLVLGAGTQMAVHLSQGLPISAQALGGEMALAAFLIPTVTSAAGQTFPLNAPSWSLFVEAVTNLGFVLVPRRFWTASIATGAALAAAMVMMAAFARLPLTYGGLAGILWLDLARGSFGFGVGVLLGGLDRRHALSAVPRWPTPLVFACLAALLLVPRSPFDLWFDPVAILLLCPALVAVAAVSRPSPRVGRWCVRAGALSYPLYIVHAPIIDVAAKLVPEGSAPIGTRVAALAVAAAVALAIAAVIARWIAPRPVAAAKPRFPDAASVAYVPQA